MIVRAVLLGLALAAAAADASAFDCGKARLPVERAICADAALKAADDRLEAAYKALAARLDGQGRHVLMVKQRDWLGWRDQVCAGDGRADPACLGKVTGARADLLEAKPEAAGPGAPGFTLAVRGRFVPDPPPAGYDMKSISVGVFYPQVTAAADGLQKAFNRKAAALALADATAPEAPYFLDVGGRVRYASAAFLSASFVSDEFSGGAHGMETKTGLNLWGDGKVLAVSDFLDAGGKAKIEAFCRAAVAKWKAAEGAAGEAPDVDAVRANIEADGKWWFGAAGATVHYDPYDVGAYAEGPFDCEIPWPVLKQAARPGAPLPFPP